MSNPQIQSRPKWQYQTIEGKTWKRRGATEQWQMADSPPPTENSPIQLKLVRQEQSPGEPYHWSLFLAPENEEGFVFQVKGDALAMRHVHTNHINVLVSQSYKDSYIIARPTEQQSTRVHYWATHEVAPNAPNQATVTENCQGWTIRVLQHLVAEGIVEQKWFDTALSLKEPIH